MEAEVPRWRSSDTCTIVASSGLVPRAKSTSAEWSAVSRTLSGFALGIKTQPCGIPFRVPQNARLTENVEVTTSGQ